MQSLSQLETDILNIIKSNSCGLVLVEIIDKANKSYYEPQILNAIASLYKKGFIRVDEGKNGNPTRYKPTAAAFDLQTQS